MVGKIVLVALFGCVLVQALPAPAPQPGWGWDDFSSSLTNAISKSLDGVKNKIQDSVSEATATVDKETKQRLATAIRVTGAAAKTALDASGGAVSLKANLIASGLDAIGGSEIGAGDFVRQGAKEAKFGTNLASTLTGETMESIASGLEGNKKASK